MINILKGIALWLIGVGSMFALSEGVEWAVLATAPVVSLILTTMDNKNAQ